MTDSKGFIYTDLPWRRARDGVIAMIDGGATIADTADAFGVTVSRVRSWIQHAAECRRIVEGPRARSRPDDPRTIQARDFYLTGLSYAKTAARIGVCASTIRKWCVDGGWRSMPRQFAWPPRIARAKEMYESGASAHQIIAEVHVTDRTLRRWASINGWARRS